MDLKPWPVDFAQKKAGIGCPQCDQGRVDETEHGVRFFVGEIADGYLQKSGPTAGYSVVIFRGRHVGAPHEMTGDEHAAFWSEVGVVAAAIERVYRPVHLNFQILGNQDPHVHVHNSRRIAMPLCVKPGFWGGVQAREVEPLAVPEVAS
jgi:diadenosine tetraphosphate (Ap4A) HIT family hydrolase